MRCRALLRFGAMGGLAVAATLLLGWWRVDGPGGPKPISLVPTSLSSMDFRLVDHQGKLVGPETLRTRASLVFFGFTYCPDICPTTLSDISSWLDALGEDAALINAVFITVDPKRDTVENLATYVSAFNPAIRGWTGSQEQIALAARLFRVTYERVPFGDDDYMVNHTASVFVFDANGSFISTIDYHESREFALPKIRRAIVQDDRSRK